MIAERTPYANVSDHEIGRHRSGGWSQSYVTTPDGRTGLIDSDDMPVEFYSDITPENLPDVVSAVWHWES